MSYAGYQRHEVPALGDIAANAIEKKQVMDLKKQEMANEMALKRQAMGARMQEIRQKDADKSDAIVSSNQDKVYKELSSIGTAPSSSFNDLMYQYADNVIKQRMQRNTNDFKNGLFGDTEYNRRSNEIVDEVKDMGETVKVFTEAYKSVKGQPEVSPFDNFVFDATTDALNPTSQSLKKMVEMNGETRLATYVKGADGQPVLYGAPINMATIKNVSTLAGAKPYDFDKEIDEQIIKPNPGNEIIMNRKADGSYSKVKDAKMEEGFKQSSLRFVNKVLADPRLAADAFFRYNGKDNTAFVLNTASPKEREEIAKKKMGAEKVSDISFVEVELDANKGMYIAKLSKDQEATVKEKLISDINNRAPRHESPYTPHVTKVNVDLRDASNTFNSIYKGVARLQPVRYIQLYFLANDL